MSIKAIDHYQETAKEIVGIKQIEEKKLREPIKTGKWSVREIVGHLHYWDKFILDRHIPFMAQGAVLIGFPDHDSYNSEGVQYISRFEATAILIDEFVNTRESVIKIASSIGRDVRFAIGVGKRQYSIGSYLSIFVKHDTHHLVQIRNKLF